MRILVLGADGMLGHQLALGLGERHEVIGTLHGSEAAYRDLRECLPARLIHGLDMCDATAWESAIRRTMPEAVINAVGIVKQRSASKDVVPSLEINALLPHRLAHTCNDIGARFVHFSTDCVYSGDRGMYGEDDVADARDLYGRTKYLGEVGDPGCITLRTSIIGLELSRNGSLVEWFLSQRGPIRGYRKAIYSGFTTLEMARIVERILVDYPALDGIYQASSEPIDKYTLLCKLRDRLGMTTQIDRDDDFRCDRSLVSERFRRALSYDPPGWDAMIDALAMQIERREASRQADASHRVGSGDERD